MGAMKSLAHDYALYLQRQAREQGDLDFDIDEVFRQIVNSEIDIPQSYVDMWVSRNSVFASENVVFDAETNSWKQQKRDKKGRFIKGFSDKTDAQLNDEYDDILKEYQEEQSYYIDAANEESIYNEMIAPYYKYTNLDQDKQMSADEFSEFLSQAIMDDNFPEKLTDIYYFQYLQKVAESVPLGILEKLHDVMEMHMNIGQASGDEDIQILGGRGIFITDILLNLKQGQEMWSAETFESNNTVNNFWNTCHDNSFAALGRKIYYNCRLFASISSGLGVVSNPAGLYNKGSSQLRYTSAVKGFPLDALVTVSNQEKPSSISDWYEVLDKTNQKLTQEESFGAETWDAEFRQFFPMKDEVKLHYVGTYIDEEDNEEQEVEGFSWVSKNDYIRFYEETAYEPCQCDERGCLSCFIEETAGWADGFGTDVSLLWFGKDENGEQWDYPPKNAESFSADDSDEYTEAEINLMRYDLVEHELENSDYNFLYDVLLYGTPGWANYTDAEVVQKFRNIFER
jgi:hypothetical protein|tara:strand:+ start:5438 stop:6973 length:1536 start_codon:yes stop_codon:yes gene_type:complete